MNDNGNDGENIMCVIINCKLKEVREKVQGIEH